MNITDTINNFLCPGDEMDRDIFFYISLLVNFILLITTSSSEIMAGSKCKANSISELIYLICKKKGGQCVEVIEDNGEDEEV